MAHLGIVEFIAMIIAIIALINFPFIIKRRKDFIKYLPGILFLVITFVAENIEEFFSIMAFAILEAISILVGVILLILAALMDLDVIFLKIRYLQSRKKSELNEEKKN